MLLQTLIRRACIVLAPFLLLACAGPSARMAPTLPPSVEEALQRARLPEHSLGVVAFPLHAASTGLRHRADQARFTGSSMKVVTGIVALDVLGPTRRGRTDLLMPETPVVDGVVNAPLYLRGGADWNFDHGALADLLRELRALGIRELAGGVVVDRTRFRPARLDIGVPPFDDEPEFPYNVIPDALHLNGSLIEVDMQADSSHVKARLSPAWPGLRVDPSAMRINDRACRDWEAEWKIPRVEGDTLVLQGGFPRNCVRRQALNVFDRQRLTEAALRGLWGELGGTITGPVREGPTPAEARTVATHLSRPLGESLRAVLKESDNALTRLLYLELGAAHPQAERFARTQDAAADQVRQWLARKGISAPELVLDNGSGLSRTEQIAPSTLAHILVRAWGGPYAPELLSGLPLAGVDGTLRRRMKDSAAEGRARLKTGTLRNVVALAGYVWDRSDRPWVMVALLNDDEAPAKGRPVLDAIAAWVASQP